MFFKQNILLWALDADCAAPDPDESGIPAYAGGDDL